MTGTGTISWGGSNLKFLNGALVEVLNKLEISN